MALSFWFRRSSGVIEVIVPGTIVFCFSRSLTMAGSDINLGSRLAMDTPWTTIPKVGSWSLRPLNAAFQIVSLVLLRARIVFAWSSVSNWRRIVDASFRIPMI
jgi:hypothetical protein